MNCDSLYGDPVPLRRSHKSNVCVRHVKKSMKKKGNGEIYKLRKTFAVYHLVPLCVFFFFWKRSSLVD